MSQSVCTWCGNEHETRTCLCPECEAVYEADRGLPIRCAAEYPVQVDDELD